MTTEHQTIDGLTGNELLVESVQREGVTDIFYLMGGPLLTFMHRCLEEGIQGVDVRHEQAAAMMAHAYTRTTGQPGVCAAAAGPGTENLVTGVATAWDDGSPLVVLGGSSPLSMEDRDAFQEVDQVSMMEPVTKWAGRIHETERIPEYVRTAFRKAVSDRPGPVYLDLPEDVLYDETTKNITFPEKSGRVWKPGADTAAVSEAIELLTTAEKPIVVAGNGVLWSDAGEEIRAFVEQVEVPLYTTPLTQGMLPQSHPYYLPRTRSTAFSNADVVLVVGTRFNFVLSFGSRFDDDAEIIQIDVSEDELGTNRACDVGIVADCKRALKQLREAATAEEWETDEWVTTLREEDERKATTVEETWTGERTPIHPMWLFRQVASVIDDDAIVVADGHETLVYSRRAIPATRFGYRLNPGPSGCMGVGIPFGIGAGVANPNKQVVVLSGDGSVGMNGFELDTAVRHGVPITVIINNNGGWTSDTPTSKGAPKPGRDLPYTRYDKVFEPLGCHGEFVTSPEAVKPAVERALAVDGPSVVNVKTDPNAQASSYGF